MKTVMQTIYTDYDFREDGRIEYAIKALTDALHAAKADGMIEDSGQLNAEDNSFNYSRFETEAERISREKWEACRVDAEKIKAKVIEDNERAIYERLKEKFGDK